MLPLRKMILSTYSVFFISISMQAQVKSVPLAPSTPPVKFYKMEVYNGSFESAGVLDVNKDGNPDIVSGSYWYLGPGFVKRYYIGDVKKYGEFYDDFSTIPMDVNGDGYTDFITGGWWGNSIRWRENPKNNDKEWPEHIIAEVGNVETTRAWDIDRDGVPEIVPNNPGKPLVCFKLGKDAVFTKYQLATTQGHGIGFGDINGDGYGDMILSDGWLQAPKDPWKGKWILHSDFKFGQTGIPIVVADVNADGLNDLIVGQGHDYGLFWYEQRSDRLAGGKRTWIRHPIDLFNSQFHTLLWIDIDGDAQPELITGKRYRAHDDKDPGSADDIGLYYYKWNGESFTKQVIAYGPRGTGKGTGNYFAVADLRGSGRKDIVVAGKDGLYIFFNLGNKPK